MCYIKTNFISKIRLLNKKTIIDNLIFKHITLKNEHNIIY